MRPGAIPKRRLSVVGTSCSGKSTLAREVARRCGLTYIEQDQLYWQPGWRETPTEDFCREMKVAISGESWVVCGNHAPMLQEIFGRATDLVWLNYSLPLVLWRGLKRTLRRVFRQEECCHGNRESFRHAFLSKDSILWWIVTTHGRRRATYMELMQTMEHTHPRIRIHNLTSPRNTRQWLDSLGPG